MTDQEIKEFKTFFEKLKNQETSSVVAGVIQLAEEVLHLRRWKEDAERSMGLMAATIDGYKEEMNHAEMVARENNERGYQCACEDQE